jgi:hypothetical protein
VLSVLALVYEKHTEYEKHEKHTEYEKHEEYELLVEDPASSQVLNLALL